ncbi:MAG: hypothetical protein WC087_01025 [Candidatus Paceibacterota bacterium]
MILTKQLQVLIESSLAEGRDYEDIRDVLMKQGFQDADISELFSQYRGSEPAVKNPVPTIGTTTSPEVDTDLGLIKSQTNVAPSVVAPAEENLKAKEKLFKHDFVHPEIKKGFVPVGFEKEGSAQSAVKDSAQTFMNVGTNTQTAAHLMASGGQRLPAPGTTLLPNEIANQKENSTPKVLNETGSVEGEAPVSSVPFMPTKVQAQQYINVGFAGMPEMEKVLAEEQQKKIEKSPWPMIFVLIVLLGLIGLFFFWFFFLNKTDEQSSEILDQLIKVEDEAPAEPAPPEYTGPRDPFTNEPLETQ